MPEFRFRRKKPQNRRTTVNNAEETAKQIQEAKKLIKPVLEPSLPEEGQTKVATTTTTTTKRGSLDGNMPPKDLGSPKQSSELLIPGSQRNHTHRPIHRETLSQPEVDLAEVERELSPVEKRNSFLQERERFLELLKSKFPDQAIALDRVGVAGGGDKEGGRREEQQLPAENHIIMVSSISLIPYSLFILFANAFSFAN